MINRTLSALLSNKCPFELLYKKKPSYDHLQSFGDLCYASTLLSQRNKFSLRSWVVVFLGYPFGYKGYKFLDLSTHIVFISHNVVFHETIFSFQHTLGSNTPSTYFLIEYFYYSSMICPPMLQVIPMFIQQPFLLLLIHINNILIRLPSHLITSKTIIITWPHTLIRILPILTVLIIYLNFCLMTNSLFHANPLLFLFHLILSLSFTMKLLLFLCGRCHVHWAPSLRS